MTTPAPATPPGLTAFIDESERDQDYYFLGALVCNENQAAYITAMFDALLVEYGETFPAIGPATELHAHRIMAGRGPWKNVPIRARISLFTRCLAVIADSGACFHVEGVDRNRLAARAYRTEFPPREIALTYLLERVDTCASRKRTLARLIADEHHTHETSQTNFKEYQDTGTWGYRSTTLARLVPPIEFVDSMDHRPLQASDMATYLYNRKRTYRERDERAVEAKVRMADALRPAVNRGSHRIWP